MLGSIVIFILLAFLSAFFSGSESAFFSIPQIEIKRLRADKLITQRVRRVLRLLERPGRLLMSILIGNTLVNVAAATVSALLISRFVSEGALNRNTGLLLNIVIVTLILLVFSEVSPKIIGVRHPLVFAGWVSLPITGIVFLFKPIAFFFDKATRGITNLLHVYKESPFMDEEELKTLFDVGEEDGALDRNEREMIHSIFEFRQTMVKEVMIPRMDMVCVDKLTPIQEVLRLVTEKGHSRIPVYDESLDNILGVLYVKDLLQHVYGQKQTGLLELIRKPYFVPESKMIDDLLREFQHERLHMAIVVDEYGGTSGLVTLEDVIEEIVGEIQDEYDREKPLYRQIDDRSWIVDAKINIEDLNHALRLNVPVQEDYESLGGFLFSLMGRIPQEKEEIRYEDVLLSIEKVVRQRIQKVRVSRLPLNEQK